MKQLACLKCSSPLEPRAGAGRPAIYCGEPCRRLAEYEIRRLDRRIAGYEQELRGLRYDGPGFDDSERLKRMRALRRWIAADEARLRLLLGGQPAGVTGGQNGVDQSGGPAVADDE